MDTDEENSEIDKDTEMGEAASKPLTRGDRFVFAIIIIGLLVVFLALFGGKIWDGLAERDERAREKARQKIMRERVEELERSLP
jgi:hypothetical protein